MPKKIVVTVTYTGPDKAERRLAPGYFSNDWDEYYHETFHSADEADERKADYERLQDNVVLALNDVLEKEMLQSSNLSPSPSSSPSPSPSMNQAAVRRDSSSCYYIHRVALKHDSQAKAYQIIYCLQGEGVGRSITISQQTIDQLRAAIVKSHRQSYDSCDDYVDYQATMANDVVSAQPQLATLVRDLYLTIDELDYVVLTSHSGAATFRPRITQPLPFPEKKSSTMHYSQFYCALKLENYPNIELCADSFKEYEPKFERLDSEFKRNLQLRLIDVTSTDYLNFDADYNWFLKAQKLLIVIKQCVDSIVQQKIAAKDQMYLLKERLIWVIHEAARLYYMDKWRKVSQAKLKTSMNDQFSNVAYINHFGRVSFDDLHDKSIAALRDLYHQLLTKGS